MISCHGGNEIRRDLQSHVGPVVLANHEYYFGMISSKDSGSHPLTDLHSALVVCLEGSLVIGGQALEEGGRARLTGTSAELLLSENTRVLVVGLRGNSGRLASRSLLRDESLLVSKPWGHEHWFTASDAPFCFKELVINEGHRTSLQFHEFKRETNLIVSGRVKLVFMTAGRTPESGVTEEDLASVTLDPVTTVDVPPRCIHRLEALENVRLFEVSTPEVDDVIRISDDSNRGSGRVESEHAGNSTKSCRGHT